MAIRIQPLTNYSPSDAYRDNILTAIHDAINLRSYDSSQKNIIYKPVHTVARDQNTFVSKIEDKLSWKENYDRRKDRNTGFFSNKTSSYQTFGTVYFEEGDLIKHGVTDDIKAKIQKVLPNLEDFSVSKNFHRRNACVDTSKSCIPKYKERTDDTGFRNIQEELQKSHQIKKYIRAASTLSSCLNNQMMTEISKKSKIELQTMAEEKIRSELQLAIGALKMKQIKMNLALLNLPQKTNDFTKKQEQSSLFDVLQQPKRMDTALSLTNDLRKLEQKDQQLKKFRENKIRKYQRNKLRCINNLLCAIVNMKMKTLKTNFPIRPEVVQDLLTRDIKISKETNLVPSKQTSFMVREDETEDSKTYFKRAKTVTMRSPLDNLISSKIQNKLMQFYHLRKNKRENSLQTWDRFIKRSPEYESNNSKTNQMKTSTEVDVFKTQQQWLRVEAAEELIKAQKSNEVKKDKNSPRDRLTKLKENFDETKSRLCTDLDNKLAKRKVEQFTLVKYKFNSLQIENFEKKSLGNMRYKTEEMRQKILQRKEKPMKWFTDLQFEILQYFDEEDIKILKLLKKISRFKFVDNKELPSAKEKLCLLTMSIPIFNLLKRSMMDSIEFILTKILEGESELLDVWLQARKLYDLKQTITYEKVPNDGAD